MTPLPLPPTGTDGRRWPASRAGRIRRTALSIALGGGLALGVAGLAHAADNPAPISSTPPGAEAGTPPGAPAGPPGPGKHRPHLDGTVTSISSSRIVIVDRDGFTRQINITSTPSGVKVGTKIHAEGSVNVDGVSLDATTVGVAPAPPAHGKGAKPRPPEAGAPRPGGAGPVPPSGAALPPAPADSSPPAPATGN